MNTRTSKALAGAVISLAALGGCAMLREAPPAGSAPAPLAAATAAPAAPRVIASFRSDGGTDQGGRAEGFAYAEKDGDARFDGLAVTEGVARVTGQVWPRKGSAWAGVGFVVSLAADDAPQDLSARRVLVMRLASPSARSLRVRLLGPDKATRDNGCYPVVVQPVTADLAEYRIALDRFAPESYCGALARTVAVTAPAVTAVEVTDPTLGPASRAVEFRIGPVAVQ